MAEHSLLEFMKDQIVLTTFIERLDYLVECIKHDADNHADYLASPTALIELRWMVKAQRERITAHFVQR